MVWKPKDIKNLRDSMGLSQRAFGELLGVTEDYIYKMEKAMRKPGKSLQILMERIRKGNEV